MWPAFEKFIQGVAAHVGCRGWAACMERGKSQVTQDRYHFHAYFYWNDGHGIDVDTTDLFVFGEVRPRVDLRSAAGTPMAARLRVFTCTKYPASESNAFTTAIIAPPWPYRCWPSSQSSPLAASRDG